MMRIRSDGGFDMSKGTWLRRIGNEMLDLVYPPGLYCICCGKIIDQSRTYRLCNGCMENMSWITERHCSKCGRPLAETDPGEKCFGCTQREASGQPHIFDKGHACTGYGACAQSVIFALKYGGRADIGDTLGEVLYDRMLAEYGPDRLAALYDIVTPIPVHMDKQKKRGFNHADLIGKGFAKRAGLNYDAGVLVRTRYTVPMKGLGTEERRANVSGAFSIKSSRLPKIKGASVLLIDDIFTTGATIDEIAGVLKDAGASRVDFLAFAGADDIIPS